MGSNNLRENKADFIEQKKSENQNHHVFTPLVKQMKPNHKPYFKSQVKEYYK